MGNRYIVAYLKTNNNCVFRLPASLLPVYKYCATVRLVKVDRNNRGMEDVMEIGITFLSVGFGTLITAGD